MKYDGVGHVTETHGEYRPLPLVAQSSTRRLSALASAAAEGTSAPAC